MDTPRLQLAATRRSEGRATFQRDVERGLSASPRRLSCRFFYDRVGSEIFEEICALPEYYLTRAEDEILREHSAEIVGEMPRRCALVELGSGSAHKTRRLIEACLARERDLLYVPIDISRTMLEHSSRSLLDAYPGLTVRALAAEYEDGLEMLRDDAVEPKLVLWLGSNVGNYDRASAAGFLARLSSRMGKRDRLLLGVDLRKDSRTLELAYDDPAGVTARFNLNLLARIDRELGASFENAQFRHVATYDPIVGRVQMFLESVVDQAVWIEALERSFSFTAGERIHTEDSYKYSPAEIESLARAGGMFVERTWCDSRTLFSSNLLAPLS